MLKHPLVLAALGFAALTATSARAELSAGASLAPYEIKNTATGKEYCQMCAYSSKPATVAAYGKLNDAGFWTDLKTLQAYHEKYPQAGFFAQVLDSTDTQAIQAKAKAEGITFPVVVAADQDWNKIYKVDASRTVYVSKNFKVVYSTVGLEGRPVSELEAKLKGEMKG